jgi:hypothetical protein
MIYDHIASIKSRAGKGFGESTSPKSLNLAKEVYLEP